MLTGTVLALAIGAIGPLIGCKQRVVGVSTYNLQLYSRVDHNRTQDSHTAFSRMARCGTKQERPNTLINPKR